MIYLDSNIEGVEKKEDEEDRKEKGWKYLRFSEELSYPPSYFTLGLLFFEENLFKAREYFEKAAKLGVCQAK